MNKGPVNLQDVFLNQARRDNVLVTVYLVSGVQLKGLVRGFDSFTIVLDSPGRPPQLVYKHAIASIVPARYVNWSNEPREAQKPEEAAEGETAETQPTETPDATPIAEE
jgi:host factor-I protein